ncbi:alpha/beta hydrolase [Rhizobium sp. L1K21]|uniref:alpha/beta hydrolase n=1 Tax=Rhizobium sp. L1K21 TaxID=2954933 RepID=UPI00209273E3|nr:alpha/beta hydrolase [Rhizobium sp. L1K21]MCO6188570.1 alpha/beta hydrolase [Rhizobium sp. L1K21]
MESSKVIDWEDAFSNGAYIDEAVRYPARWDDEASDFRTAAQGQTDIAYGEHERERLDLFMPTGTPKGLAVFVHGGYWLDFDKSSWSAFAAGPLSAGFAVAMPSYTLAPHYRISQMTRQIGRAITVAAAMVDGPIRLSGHSAGGHLVTRMVCDDTPLAPEITGRIDRIVSISGLHDLRPLLFHSMNEKLRLDEEEAVVESAVLHDPLPGVQLMAWVGANERPEFLRQSALIREAWGRKGIYAKLVAEPQRHHFDVIEGLKSADHPLTQAFVA